MRGVINPADLHLLLVDDYQREAAPITQLKTLVTAFKAGDTIPDIILGMRGGRTRGRDKSHILLDPVYIIDGQQRVNAARHILSLFPDTKVHLGATIHFETEKEWEREQFRILNSLRAKVSPNVLLRNRRDDSASVLTLYGLTHAKEFALCNRVCWGQNMARGHLTTALVVLKTVSSLHRHVGGGGKTDGASISQLVNRMDQVGNELGLNIMRENTIRFFDLIDEFWGLRAVQHREIAIQARSALLIVVARLISDHQNFWTGPGQKRLFMDADTRRKFKQFSLSDPTVVQLAGSSGASRHMLYQLLRDHVNSGRRTNRLKPRKDIDLGDLVTTQNQAA